MLDRRTLIGGIASLAASLGARAQVPGRRYRIGYLGYTASDTPSDLRVWDGFVQRLRELGFAEGTNLLIERRFAEGRPERYTAFAIEMVALGVDVVVATSGDAARAVMDASRTLPIVTTAIPDPVRTGLVASLARPGGQLTGLTNLADELVPKRLELLRAVLQHPLGHVAYASCPRCLLNAGGSEVEVSALRAEREAAARSLGVRLLQIDVNAASEFDAATTVLRREKPEALLIGANPVNHPLRSRWLAFATEQRLPVLAPYREFGAMLTYGPVTVDIYRKAAEYVARILRGARAGDLPMEQPTMFEFVVNLGMAEAIGITLPPSVLLRADEVIR